MLVDISSDIAKRLRYCGRQHKLLADFKKMAVACSTKGEFCLEALLANAWYPGNKGPPTKSGIWDLESTTWNPESKPVLNSLTKDSFAGLYIVFRFRRLGYCGKQQKLLAMRTLRRWLSPVARSMNSAWKLCWRASVDDWAASTFHSRCDGKEPTVTIIRVGRYIFGGYTSRSWGK